MKKLLLALALASCAFALCAAPPMRDEFQPLAGRLQSLVGLDDEQPAVDAQSARQPDHEPNRTSGEYPNLSAVGLDPLEIVSQPDLADITFVPPMQNDAGGLRIGRLFAPRDGRWNEQAIAQVRRRQTGPHGHALLAIHDGDESHNAQAKAELDSDAEGYVYSSMKGRKFLSRILALDWIRWDSEAEFEAAAAKVIPLEPLASNRSSEKEGAYWSNDYHPQGGSHSLELLLVAVCHGRPGPSGQWAAERLTHLGQGDPPDAGYLYSPYHAANVLAIQSKRGGGRESCPTPPNRMGGYESYFASAGWILWGWDTATGSTLFRDNLYFRTRWQGFMLEHDPVERYGSPGGDIEKIFACHAGLTGSTQTAWMTANIEYDDPRCAALLACAPSPPAPVDPSPAEPVVDTVGSQWHYYDNPADRANAFHVTLSCRDLSHYRYDNEDRTFGVTYRGVGLVMGGSSYRGSKQSATANGLSLEQSGEQLRFVRPYWDRRASLPLTVAMDPAYLVQTGKPSRSTFKWHQNWLSLVHHGGHVSRLTTDWEFSPTDKRLLISDTVQHDGTVTPRLHFSPSHPVTVDNDSFVITNGTGSLRVTVTSNHQLVWQVDPVPDKNRYSTGRVAQFVTVTPVEVQGEVTFETRVEAID